MPSNRATSLLSDRQQAMLPDALFARSVRVVGGVYVKKPDELLDVPTAGDSVYHFFDNLAPRTVIEKKP